MRDAQAIIKRPLLTEKSARLRETGGASEGHAEGDAYAQQVVFEVARDANKIEIRSAVQALFKVTVTAVRTLVVRGKQKRVGRFSGPGTRKPRAVEGRMPRGPTKMGDESAALPVFERRAVTETDEAARARGSGGHDGRVEAGDVAARGDPAAH